MASEEREQAVSRIYSDYINTERDIRQPIRDGFDAGFEAGRLSGLRTLASAMKKTMPPELIKEISSYCDPLTAFLEEIRD